MQRRDLLTSLGFGAFLAAAGSVAAMFVRFLTPNLVAPAPGRVGIGRPEDYPAGALTYVENARVFVGRDARGLYALVAICTHLGCTPRMDRGQFVCPCHGSRFAADGRVTGGPASRPLERAFVGAADGKLFVDRSRIVDADYRFPA